MESIKNICVVKNFENPIYSMSRVCKVLDNKELGDKCELGQGKGGGPRAWKSLSPVKEVTESKSSWNPFELAQRGWGSDRIPHHAHEVPA